MLTGSRCGGHCRAANGLASGRRRYNATSGSEAPTSRVPRQPGRPPSGRPAPSAAARTAPHAPASPPLPAPFHNRLGGRIDRRTVGAPSVAVARPIDLSPTGIGDHQDVAAGSHADGVQAADAAHRDAKGMPISGGARHAGPKAGERTWPAADHDGVQIGHRQRGIGERGQHIWGEPFGVCASVDCDPLSQHGAIRAVQPHDPGRHRRGSGVQGEDQAHEQLHCQVAIRTSDSLTRRRRTTR